MRTNITLKNIPASPTINAVIEQETSKLQHKITAFGHELPILSILIKKETRYFTGILWLYLPKKSLVAHFRDELFSKAILNGFTRLNKEYDQYKGTHFAGYSKYPDRTTIRKFTL